LRRALAAAFTRLDDDDEVAVIVMAGSERAFCAGADLTEYEQATPLDIIGRDMDRLWGAIAQCRKPVIAAVRGHALGGGCKLAMLADILIAGEDARFGQPEVRIGLMPGGGATQRLTRRVGPALAMRLLLIGEPMTGAQAAAHGLVAELQPDTEVEPRALAMAQRLSSGPRLAQRFIKQAVLAAQNLPLEQGLEFERKSFQLLFATEDKREGIAAQLGKRVARFLGR
jgi:enoyl-CoA hydratase/carnithine racemase